MLEVRLFGAGRASYLDKALDGFPGQQAGLLLCYLFLNNSQPQPRERLAAVFWEDRPTATARKYLRNALWRLKRMLARVGADPGKILDIREDGVGIGGPENWRLDIDDFDRAAADTRRTKPDSLSQVQVDQLERAVRLYHGDLLTGLYEDWTLYDRERLRLLYLGMRQKLMVHHGTYGRFEAALEHGVRILETDPAREKIHRHLMRLFALNGDRNAALAQYKRCKQVLRDELNLAPMRETRRLYHQIKDNTFDRELPVAETAPPPRGSVRNRLQTIQRLADRIHTELRSLEKLLNADP